MGAADGRRCTLHPVGDWVSDIGYSADGIEVLPSEEAVRRRPSMYIGTTGPMGVAHLVFGLVGEVLSRRAVAGTTRVDVVTAPMLVVSDDGEPATDDEIAAWTRWTPAAKDPDQHDSEHTIGYPVAIPLSSVFVATLDSERRRQQVWVQGKVVSPLVVIGAGVARGTRLALTPDAGIFAGATLPTRVVRRRLEELAVLHPELTFTLDDEVLPSYGGVEGFARWLAGDCVRRAVHRQESADGVTVEVAIVWAQGGQPPTERSWVNGLQAEGDHVDGLRDALKPTEREGRVAVLRVVLPFAEYVGRTRRQLTSKGLRGRVAGVVRRALAES